MKKFYLFILLFVCVLSQAQKHTDRYYNSWRLGLNMGAMWQVADVRSTAGFAGGFTLEKGLCENKTNFFSLAIKGRGLWGNTYGLDYVRNYDIKNNPSLNGTYNPQTNYDTVALGIAPFIYNNYKTKIAEGALELQICFNRLRERTNILLNIWGGIGFTSYRTAVNLLDDKNLRYNYNLVDSSGSKALTLSSHNFLLDDSYESFGIGSKKGNVLTLSPSCGIGFGYRFNDYISILWEHKITFPQGTYSDYLDGIKASNNDWLGCVKDYYHYSGLTLSIRMGGKKGKSNTNNVNNYTPTTTNTTVTSNSVAATNTTVANPVKPIVNITNPPYTPYTESVNVSFNIKADVYNVSQRSQLYVTFNGSEVKNYTWSGKTISFLAQLALGNNIVSVTATNNAGSDSKSATIIYSGPPPQITITTPGTNKVTSNQSTADVIATILNVSSAQNISVIYNGQPFYSFAFDAGTKLFSSNVNLTKGTNTMEITAINDFGKDVKSQIIIYNPISVTTTTATTARPVKVTITDPSVNPYLSAGQNYNVKAKVTGVTSQSQVTVTANGNAVPFNYLGGNVDFNTALNPGNNLMVVSASNGKSSDSKSTIITYDPPKKVTPPTVVILKPQPSPETTNQTTYLFKAQTTFINDRSQLEVKFNGNVISGFSFDAGSGIIDYNANLTLNSNNFFEVKATNSYGSANASAIVKQEIPKTKVICHKKDKINYETITIFENEWAQHQAHGDYDGACKTEPSDPTPDPQITICHLNSNGSKQTITIPQSTWAQHQAHGDVVGACPPTLTVTPEDKKITICHIPPGNNQNPQTIEINESAWPAHQAHGDTKGACPKIIVPENPVDLDPEITICHKNADGSSQTIVVKQSTWAQHQAHGDSKGECPKIIVPENPVELDPDLTICHKNADGSSQTIVIKQSAWAQHQAHGDSKGVCPKIIVPENPVELDPDISICHKNGDGTEVKMTIKQSQWAAHQAHGDYAGVSCVQTNTAASSSTVEICHNNGDGSKTTMVIPIDQFSAHRAHGDIMGKCAPQASQTNTTTPGGLTICHKNGDGSTSTMVIAADQWSVHRGHGDVMGTCPPPQPEDKKITICHIPPGNNQNPQTIEINESAWPAHQAHGDTKGACPEQKSNPGGGKGKGAVEETKPENNGNNSPGKTNQTTEQPQETIKLKPR